MLYPGLSINIKKSLHKFVCLPTLRPIFCNGNNVFVRQVIKETEIFSDLSNIAFFGLIYSERLVITWMPNRTVKLCYI